MFLVFDSHSSIHFSSDESRSNIKVLLHLFQGGALWFQNLTEYPHGVLGPIFPLLIAGLHYANVQVPYYVLHLVDKFSLNYICVHLTVLFGPRGVYS